MPIPMAGKTRDSGEGVRNCLIECLTETGQRTEQKSERERKNEPKKQESAVNLITFSTP